MNIARRQLLQGVAATGLLTVSGRVGAAGSIAGLELDSMDRSVRPGADFNRYANGGWIDRTAIPPDRSSIDVFSGLNAVSANRARAILERCIAAPADADQRKLGDLAASLLDPAGAEPRGLDPIRAELARIDAVDSPRALAVALARMSRDFIRDRWAGQDFFAPVSPVRYWNIDDPDRYAATLVQGGLGLPDSSYYLDKGAAFQAGRLAYSSYLETLFQAIAHPQPAQAAGRVMALEKTLAAAHRPRVELTDLRKRRNVMTPLALAKAAPGFDWPAYLEALGYAGFGQLQVADPLATTAFAAAARDFPLDDWRLYLASRTLNAFAPYGPKGLAEAHFNLYEGALKGVKTAPERWLWVARQVDLAMGPAVGRLYMDRHLSRAGRKAALDMTADIKAAMRRRLAGAAWMAPETRATAFAKLAAVRIEIGGDARPRDYTALAIDRNDPWGNMVRAARLEYARNLEMLKGPVDRGEWEMLPHTANGQSNPMLRTITITAGLLQPPMFDPADDPAIRYGRLGCFIGHELTHQFDALGATFDADGRMANWWTAEDRARFDAATEVLAKQFSAYEPVPRIRINGRQTLNENLSDLGGLQIAFDAWKASLKGRPAPVIAGLTGEQRFFLGYASMWRRNTRPEVMPRILATSGHAPGPWRVLGVRNHDGWYDAFAVGPADPLWVAPAERARIW